MALSRASLITQQKLTKNMRMRWKRGACSDFHLAHSLQKLSWEYEFAADWCTESKALQGRYNALALVNAEQARSLCPSGLLFE